MKVRLKLQPILIFCFFAALGPSNGAAVGQTVPVGYTILDITLSPDHRYGVTVPDLNTPNPQNSLVEVETGRVLAVIQARTQVTRAQIITVSFRPGGRKMIHFSYGRWTANGAIRLSCFSN